MVQLIFLLMALGRVRLYVLTPTQQPKIPPTYAHFSRQSAGTGVPERSRRGWAGKFPGNIEISINPTTHL